MSIVVQVGFLEEDAALYILEIPPNEKFQSIEIWPVCVNLVDHHVLGVMSHTGLLWLGNKEAADTEFNWIRTILERSRLLKVYICHNMLLEELVLTPEFCKALHVMKIYIHENRRQKPVGDNIH